MKKALLVPVIFILCVTAAGAQFGLSFAVKGGINFAKLSSAAGIKASNYTGYMIGGYISPKPKKILGFRSEIILSRQGYNYTSNTNTGKVNLDYLLLPQLITVNFTKKLQIHAGGQLAFLLNAKVDSSGGGGGSLFSYFNRFDYGIAGGIEVSPVLGFFIGGRVNAGLNNVNQGGGGPNFIPKVDVKNNVVQLYLGWRF